MENVEYRQVSMRLELDLYTKIEEEAKESKRTVTGQVNYIIAEYFKLKDKFK